MKQVVIVGAGISGLTTAFHVTRLARARGIELRTTILESDVRPGGRVWTERTGGFQIELGANGFLDSKPSTLDLCNELGLGADLITARDAAKHRFILWHDALHPLPTGPYQLLRSRLLTWRGKLRLLAEPFIRRRRGDSDESVHDFAQRRIGLEAARILVDAMVTGIHAGDPRLLSAIAAFPRMVELERTYGSLIRAMPKVRRQRQADAATRPTPTTGRRSAPGGNLWSLHNGMRQLIERLLERSGAELIAGVSVRRIEQLPPSMWQVHGDGTARWCADALVLACPSFAQAGMLEPVDAELASQIGGIQYNSIAGVALGYRTADLPRSLDGFGYLSPGSTRRDVLGVLWSSSIFENRSPHGTVLLQAMCGGWNRPQIVAWDDERIVTAVRQELEITIGVRAAPVFCRVIRWPAAIPQYHIGHRDRLAAISERCALLPGLHLTGNSFRGISVNDCTDNAIECAHQVVDGLAASGRD